MQLSIINPKLDSMGHEYTLSFPNEEVKYGFIESLMPEIVLDSSAGSGNVSSNGVYRYDCNLT